MDAEISAETVNRGHVYATLGDWQVDRLRTARSFLRLVI